MRWIANITAAFLGLAVLSFQAQAADGFLTAAPDVPLMDTLEEVAASSIIFDKPGGRIIDVVLEGETDQIQVEAFYTQALSALGWQAIDPATLEAAAHAAPPSLAFQNEWERLTLAFEGRHKGALQLRVSITPIHQADLAP